MTGSFLDRIIADRKKSIAEDKKNIDVSQLLVVAGAIPPWSLKSAAEEPGITLIAEIKQARPEVGVIRENFSVPLLAESYLAGGARAISVLTEPDHFQGSWAYLRIAKELGGLPVLCKDFIIDKFQIRIARAMGADAVLLIAAALDDDRLSELIDVAHEHELEVLTEATNEVELERALAGKSDLVGINNRDLKTLAVDLNVSLDLLGSRDFDRPIVVESGILTRDDVVKVEEAGAAAILVGTALMESPDPAAKARELLGV